MANTASRHATAAPRCRWPATSRSITGSAGLARAAARGSKGTPSVPSPAPMYAHRVGWLIHTNGPGSCSGPLVRVADLVPVRNSVHDRDRLPSARICSYPGALVRCSSRSISIMCLTARARVRRLARVQGGCGRPGSRGHACRVPGAAPLVNTGWRFSAAGSRSPYLMSVSGSDHGLDFECPLWDSRCWPTVLGLLWSRGGRAGVRQREVRHRRISAIWSARGACVRTASPAQRGPSVSEAS